MIKLLCVVGDVYPPKTGGDQAVFNALKLLQNNVDLYIFVLSNNSLEFTLPKYQEVLPKSKLGFFNLSKRDKYETTFQISLRIKDFILRILHLQKEALNRELNLSINLERNANLYAAINQFIFENQIDIVQFEFGYSLFWAEGIVEPVKKVFIQHEIQYVVNKQRLQKDANKMEIMHWAIEKNRELAMMNSYDAVITLSENDKNRLIKDGVSVPIYASFAKTQLRESQRINYEMLKNIDLVFVGPESHIPNRHGLQWFLNNVWGKILEQHPNTTLYIIGTWKRNTISNWMQTYKNICFKGFVEDLISAIQKKIMIVPILEGSGIRMKILEAANNGIPFVSCTIGAEGLGFRDNENCFITDNPLIFAKRINELLNDHKKLQYFSDSAYQHVKQNFSDEAFIESRMHCYNDVYNSKKTNT